MHKEKLGSEELYSALRINGIKTLKEIDRAYLEESGEISIFKAQEPTKGLCLFPEEHSVLCHRNAGDRVTIKRLFLLEMLQNHAVPA